MQALGASRTSVVPGGALAGGWARNALWKTARAVPSLDLRFADNKSLGDAVGGNNLVTFTRASSGTYVGSDGLIQTATTNEPRFYHNPTTGESLGLLVEEASTNLFLQSNAFTTTWSNTDTVATATQTTAPDGSNAGWKLAAGTGTSNHNVFQSIAFTAVATTASVFVKYLDHRWVGIRIGFGVSQFFGSWDLQNGVVGSVTAGATIGMQAVGNGWYRLTLTATLTTAGSANCIIGLNNADALALTTYTGTGTGIYLFGAQLEAGAFPTSYIPTTSATATRAADVASITETNFSSWYNQTEGTVFAETQLQSIAARSAAGFDINDNSTNNRIVFRALTTSVTDQVVIRSGSSTVFSAAAGVSPAPTTASRKSAVGYKVNDFMFTAIGSAGFTGTTGAVPVSVNQMLIGYEQGPTGQLGGTIKRLTYWPTRLSNEVLQRITQP
jgi:hypothetical protein